MDLLPLEIGTLICSYLDHLVLTGFSLVDKKCNQAARAILFSRLHIGLSTVGELDARIDGIMSVLQRGK